MAPPSPPIRRYINAPHGRLRCGDPPLLLPGIDHGPELAPTVRLNGHVNRFSISLFLSEEILPQSLLTSAVRKIRLDFRRAA